MISLFTRDCHFKKYETYWLHLFLLSLQLAWSQDSRRFLIVGNGHNSSVVVYDITCGDPDEKNPPKLREAWRVRAGHPFSSRAYPLSCHHSISQARDKTSTKDCDPQDVMSMSTVNPSCQDSGLEYKYGDAFYMAEINPSGNVFAVEERPQKSTLTRLYSPGGELLKTSELSIPTTNDTAVSNKESATTGRGGISAVQTLLISMYKDGSYALVVQGGYVIFVDAEQLTIRNSFKAVGNCNPYHGWCVNCTLYLLALYPGMPISNTLC